MKLFCFICKRHIEVPGKGHDALEWFHAHGHSRAKVKQLRRGLVGVPPRTKRDTELPEVVGL